jgi:parallel beta-helix repeat protein
MRALAALLLLLCSVLPAYAGEPLRYRGEGTLWQDTVWEGEVLVDGILTVAPGVTLEIRPGTTVRFTRMESNGDGIGEHELFIQGTLRAVGTAGAPIRFTSAEVSPVPGDWGALNVMASDEENVLEHCQVEYAYRGFHAHFSRAALRDSEFRRSVRGIQFQESTVAVERCRVVDNCNGLQFRDSTVTLSDSVIGGNYWGVRCVYSDLDLRHCRIEGNLVNGANLRDTTVRASGNRVAGNRRGLYLQRSRGTVTGNDLLANSEHGIFLENSDCEVADNRVAGNGRAGIKWVASRGRLAGNRLTDNGEYALINDGAEPLDARGNWWGTADPVEIAAAIRDGADRPGAGMVDASAALPAAPAAN